MRSPSTAASFFSSGVVDASFFSSGMVDIVRHYAFFNFQPWLRLASMAPKPPTEFRFPLSRMRAMTEDLLNRLASPDPPRSGASQIAQ